MTGPRSDATQLREMKRQLNQALRALDKAKKERDIYRVCATEAEKEAIVVGVGAVRDAFMYRENVVEL